MTTSVWYCTSEDVRDALDSKTTARDDRAVARAIAAASRTADACTARPPGFYRPQVATRSYDWPPAADSAQWSLRLDGWAVTAVTTLTVAGAAVVDYYLEPAAYGPPYDRIDVNRSSVGAYSSGTTPQRAITVAGVWGNDDTQETAGALGASVNASVTTWTVTDGSLIGVGDHLTCGTERVIVTDRAQADTGINVAGSGVTALASDTALPVATPTSFGIGEVIQVGSERMLVTSRTGTAVVVVRAFDGTVLAAHAASADVYASRSLTVTRAAQGSTAAAHTGGDAVTRHVVTPAVHALTVAAAIGQLGQEQAGYRAASGASGGSGGGKPAASPAGSDLAALQARVVELHGRLRHRGI